MDKPTKTAEQVLSLPEYFPYDSLVVDTPELAEKHKVLIGTTINRPKMTKLSFVGVEPDDIMFCQDPSGRLWQPICSDGVWYKEEILF